MKIIFFLFFAQRVIVRAVSSVAILVLCRVYANACDSACNRFVGRYAITIEVFLVESTVRSSIFSIALLVVESTFTPTCECFFGVLLRAFLQVETVPMVEPCSWYMRKV